LALSEPTTARTLCPQIPSLPASASAPPAGPGPGDTLAQAMRKTMVVAKVPCNSAASAADSLVATKPEIPIQETERSPVAAAAGKPPSADCADSAGSSEAKPTEPPAIVSTPQKPVETTGQPPAGHPVEPVAVTPVVPPVVATGMSLADAVQAAGKPGNPSTPISPRAWQVSPVLPVEAKSLPTSASPMVHLVARRESWAPSPGGSGTPRKSLVYSQTPSSGTVTISSVATPLRSPSSCSPTKHATSLMSEGQASVVIGVAPASSSPATRRRRSSPPEGANSAESWHRLYLREVGRHPATAEQLRAFVVHRGGHLPWVVARNIVPARQITIYRNGVLQGL